MNSHGKIKHAKAKIISMLNLKRFKINFYDHFPRMRWNIETLTKDIEDIKKNKMGHCRRRNTVVEVKNLMT